MTAGIALVCCVSFTLLLVAAGLGSCYDCELDRRPFALVAFLWIASLIVAPVVLRGVWKRADPAVGVARRMGAVAFGLALGVGAAIGMISLFVAVTDKLV